MSLQERGHVISNLKKLVGNTYVHIVILLDNLFCILFSDWSSHLKVRFMLGNNVTFGPGMLGFLSFQRDSFMRFFVCYFQELSPPWSLGPIL